MNSVSVSIDQSVYLMLESNDTIKLDALRQGLYD
jgi:hypothetical protein